jgi:glycosyltransferase involved in cell wall biosynthesis
MKLHHKAVFVSPVKNCEEYISNTIKNIVNVANIFSDYLIIFIESDSTDNSLAILNSESEKNNKINVFTLGNLSETFSSRTKRLEVARNYGLDICIQNKLFDFFDYYVSFDSDDVNKDITPEAVLSCFNYPTDSWDVMCANQEIYYDYWALRCKGWLEEDCWYKIKNRPFFMSSDQALAIYLKSRVISIPEDFGLIEVDAAYGGFSIFKTSIIINSNARYNGVHDDGINEQCDTFPFVQTIKNYGGKIFINSAMINMRNGKDS